jgi:hypothetical protein
MLPENITADTLEHWMEPIKVQVSKGTFLCDGEQLSTDGIFPGRIPEAFQASLKQTTMWLISIDKNEASCRERRKARGGEMKNIKGKMEIKPRDIKNKEGNDY